jgi:hypothetical protein
MRAISLWQPWASAIALGAKTIETRDWSTGYRGPLAIHAAKHMIKAEMIDFGSSWNWCAALDFKMGSGFLWDEIPFGAIVATCELVDCRPTGSFTVEELDILHARPGHLIGWRERQMGDFSLGRFGWVLKDIRALDDPLPFKGAQGFFDVPNSFLETRS